MSFDDNPDRLKELTDAGLNTEQLFCALAVLKPGVATFAEQLTEVFRSLVLATQSATGPVTIPTRGELVKNAVGASAPSIPSADWVDFVTSQGRRLARAGDPEPMTRAAQCLAVLEAPYEYWLLTGRKAFLSWLDDDSKDPEGRTAPALYPFLFRPFKGSCRLFSTYQGDLRLTHLPASEVDYLALHRSWVHGIGATGGAGEKPFSVQDFALGDVLIAKGDVAVGQNVFAVVIGRWPKSLTLAIYNDDGYGHPTGNSGVRPGSGEKIGTLGNLVALSWLMSGNQKPARFRKARS